MPKSFANPVLEPEEYRQTTWYNPLDQEVQVKIYEGPGRTRKYVVPPKGSCPIPSEHDLAVRTEHNGVVVGGLAPMLRRLDGENPPIHEALDAEKAEQRQQEEEAMKAVLARETAEKALLIAHARAEAAKAKSEKKSEPKKVE